MAELDRIKCGYCWAEWPRVYTTRTGLVRSGWWGLAWHLEDRAGEGGHPELNHQQLTLIRLGATPGRWQDE